MSNCLYNAMVEYLPTTHWVSDFSSTSRHSQTHTHTHNTCIHKYINEKVMLKSTVQNKNNWFQLIKIQRFSNLSLKPSFP